MSFDNSFAVIDARGRLRDWDAGFAAEFGAAAHLIAAGASFAAIARGAEQREGVARGRAADVMAGTPFSYADAQGRIIQVTERPTAAGGVCRLAAAVATPEARQASPMQLQGWMRRHPDGSYSFKPVDDEIRRFFRVPDDIDTSDTMSFYSRFDFPEDSRTRVSDEYNRSAETLDIVVNENRFHGWDNSIRWIQTTNRPQREADGTILWVTTMRDITREKVAEDQVELLRAVVVKSVDAVLIMEADEDAGTSRIVYVNPATERLLGYSASQMIGQPAQSFARHDLNGGLTTLASEMMTREGLTTAAEVQITDAAGGVIWVEARGAMVQRLNASTHRWVLLMRDIGERRRAQAELMRARDAAEAASRAKDEFLANMSHEIRTPMNGVLGMTELLLETRLNEEQRRYGEAVRQSGETLLTILNDILDISKLEAGKVDLETIDFDLAEMVESAATLLASRGREKGLDIGVFVDPAAHRVFRGDPTRLRQILLNLIGNGVKFTDRGAVSVEVAPVFGARDGGARTVRLRFEVKDTGIGIPDEIRRRLFDKFSQADSSITRRYGGTGLGLAICKQLIELMGGEIGVHSVAGVGSTFWFELPLAVSDTPVADYETLLPLLRGLRVLAVDDIEMNLDIITRQLSGLGMEVNCCRDAFDAMAELERAWHRGRPYSIVFLDQMMPGLSGEGLAKRLRSTPRLAGTKLVLVSSAGAHGAAAPQLLDAVLEKPLRRRELVRALAALRGAGLSDAEERHGAGGTQPRPGGRVRVLLAEDNAINQQFVRAVLDKAGHEVTVASDGVAAVEAVRDGDFDLVLMDVQMPDLDGVGATRRIRALPTPKSAIPIVALTANAMSGAAEQYLAAGMDDYVSKPIKPSTLLAKVEQHGGARRPAPVPAAATAPADDRILDEEALAMLADVMSPEEIRELIGGFLTDARSRVTRIGELSTRGDLNAAAREAHILVSSTGTVGARRVSELAQSLELACKAFDRAAAGRLAPDLDAAFARAAAALGKWQTQLLQLH